MALPFSSISLFFVMAYLISVSKSQFFRSRRFVWHPYCHNWYLSMTSIITFICHLCQFMTHDRCQTEVVKWQWSVWTSGIQILSQKWCKIIKNIEIKEKERAQIFFYYLFLWFQWINYITQMPIHIKLCILYYVQDTMHRILWIHIIICIEYYA